MPRRARDCPAGMPVHVIQRGNNRQNCFATDSDFAAYAQWLREGAERYDVAIHAWVFMSNHVHLLLTPGADDAVSRLMQFVGRLYVRRFNHRQARSGTLFEGRFRSCPIEAEDYVLACLRYIELNPVRAGMVRDPAEYPWSSYRSHAFGTQTRMWTPHPLYLGLAAKQTERQQVYRKLVAAALPNEVIATIREFTNRGLALDKKLIELQESA